MKDVMRPEVLFFDVNETLLDLSTLKENIRGLLDGRDDFIDLWFTTLLHHSLVTSASGQYEDFGKIGAATLQMVAANHDITIPKEVARDVVINSFRHLKPHPKVKDALTQLKDDGYKLVAFTNSSKEGVEQQLTNASIADLFEARLSIEDSGKFKPFTQAYDWAAQQMQTKPTACMMIAAHGWDVAGAQWAGWRAAFVARPGHQQYPLAPQAEIVGADLKEVALSLMALQKNA
ncbi:haloacid dehalogenase type II [Nonlabens agnitus]|uniref:Haloacid dehalogenase, type II n=1 Tax=Nonlabens agnitus TaxID=870484 RepID=A0A2S9WSU3_9FLAO|nr:haloacid dehalogenase type II [Nonlabens agnitus]PRP66551.1 haloacid dehalogenase, type II [Nonlabens agnitus]